MKDARAKADVLEEEGKKRLKNMNEEDDKVGAPLDETDIESQRERAKKMLG